MRKILVFLSLFCLAAGFGLSQQQGGNIYGSVVDENQAGIPGALLTLTSDVIGKMTAISGPYGGFKFLSIPVGSYEIKAELENFAVLVQKNITVQLGGNVTLKMVMVPKRVKEEVVVTAAPRAIDAKKTTHATNLNKDELQALPTARDPFVVIELTPGLAVDRANVGGSEGGQQSNFVSSGVGRISANWNTDGINTTDQIATGAAPQYYDFDAFEEIQIQTAGADITSMTAGAQINMITKRGGNKVAGGARIYFTDESLQGENAPEGFDVEKYNPATIHSIKDVGVNIGGPLVMDKLWFWMGSSLQDIRKYALVKTEAGEDIIQSQEISNFEFKANTVLGKHRLEGFFNWSNKNVVGRVSNSHLDAWESHYQQKSPHPFYKIQDEFTVSDNLFLSAKLGYFEGGFLLTPIGPKGGIAYYNSDEGRYWGTYYESDYIRHQTFAQLTGDLFIERFLGAGHQVKFGAEYKLFPGIRYRTYYSQRLYYRYYNSPTDNDPYRAYIYRNSDYSYDLDRLSFFIQDSINYKRLTILLGLRYDIQTGGVNDLTVPGTNVDWAGEYNMPSVSVKAQDLNFSWKIFSPRIGLIYDFTGAGKTLAKFHFGLYGEHFNPDFCYDLASTYGYVRFSWDDKNGDGFASSDEVSYYRTYDYFNQTDPADVYDDNLTSPKTMEFTAGLEHELFADFAVGVNFLYRKRYNFYTSQSYIDDNGTIRLPTPDDWEIGGYMPAEYGGYAWWQYKPGIETTTIPWNTTRPDYYQRYFGVDITFKKRLTADSRWMVNGSFTWQKWTRHYPSRFSYGGNHNPTDHEPVELMDGYPMGFISGSSGATDASMNPRWMLKLGFMAQLPLKINFSGTFVARDGYILPEYYVDRSVETSTGDNPSTYTAPYGTYRLNTHYLMNLRVERGFPIGFAKLIFSIDCFNVFNTDEVLDRVYDASSSIYDQDIMITSPRIFRFGVRIDF